MLYRARLFVMIKRDASMRPWWLPGGVVAFGLVLLYGAAQLGQSDNYSRIGPGLFVTAIGIALVGLGIALAVQIARGMSFTPSDSEGADTEGPTKLGPFLTAVAATAAPLVLMQPAGFPVTASVVFAGVARAFGSTQPFFDLAIGAVLGVLAWFFFAWLGVNLGPFFPLLKGF